MKDNLKRQLSTTNWKPRAMRAAIVVSAYFVGLGHFPGNIGGTIDLDRAWIEWLGALGACLGALLTGRGEPAKQ